jgi:L-seryl-tRNA(Ser) seleniumtransferase
VEPTTFPRDLLRPAAGRRLRRRGSGPGGGGDFGRGPEGRDYFAELGVRPFINAAGTYTAMTRVPDAPEVIAAYEYASKRFVMLDELHDKVGQRIATLLRAKGRW